MPSSSLRRQSLRIEVNFSAYPLQASLGALGRKWALLVLMNIALSRAQRFNQMLRSAPGMSKRILAMRLHELERDGFIHRAERSPGFTKWELTQKGADVLPVLLTLIHFGSRWRSPNKASDGPSGTIGPTFDVTYRPEARRTAPSRPRTARPRPTPHESE
ncbi:MAG: helix-turn-helix transcriptional regulator [Thermoplasmata archaeon]|nr:helix-turn-helix transcriptional regulator [Thermoplasmata archaeon]MCI4357247.1 helix-turn-helix transcriptional regulator [Thermoplasmata archaeon]